MKYYMLIIVLMIFTFSCGDDTGKGPSKVYYGEDICERCKMIISDQKFASQYRTAKGEINKFDDTGCMIEYIIENDNIDDRNLEIFVIDYNTGQWINAGEAYFSHSKSVKTPMDYGIIAFGDWKSAETFSRQEQATLIGKYSEVKKFLAENQKTDE